MIVDFALAHANIDETEGAEELFQGVYGFALADRNIWKADLMK
jgi:hypothetical protein